MKFLTTLERALLFSAAIDPNLYAKCTPTEQQKLLTNGGFVCIPAIMAFFSAIFASKWLFEDILPRIVLVFVYVILIYFLDRAIIMYTKTGELNFALLMRATLALALSFLMAEPIVIEIFSDEIIADEARRMNAIEAHENNLLQMQIAPINLEISKNDSIMNSFLFELNREATGEGGSKKPGTGPIFTKRQHLYDEKKKEVDMNKQQKLEHIQILSKQTEERIRGECKNVATGLSGKYNTLDRLATQSSAIYWGTLLFRIVLVLFDMLPLLIKLIKPKRREELYSYLAQQQNDNYFDALNSQRKSGFQTVSNQVSSLSQHQLSESQRVLRQNTVDNLKIFIQQMANDSYDIHRTKKEAEAMIARLDDIDLKKTLIRRLNALIKAYYEDLQQKDKNNVFKTTFN